MNETDSQWFDMRTTEEREQDEWDEEFAAYCLDKEAKGL